MDAGLAPLALGGRWPERFPPPFASAWGDDASGLWTELEVAAGPVVQRLRWIEPGDFLMGSPEDEPERSDREGPQHRVTLTRGFWLADTACTQALWQAVTGVNPSRFKGAERPVEQVSWENVQAFLRSLEPLLPGCRADLPSEAEWEYACRAGTTTPFSFGDNIDPALVNYNGNYPYAGGERGRYREATVPVKSLPPNPWGLYEMHGNVWEWCADGLRDYEESPKVDPYSEHRARRAVRGGSWSGGARRARSAVRLADLPGLADRRLGFRLCLRSSEPGPGRGRPGGPAGRPPGGRAAAPPREQAAPARESAIRPMR